MNKITEQELTQIQTLKNQYQELLYNLGVVEMQLSSLKNQKQMLIDNLSKVQSEEQKLTTDLAAKYGENVQVNTDTGEIS